MLIDDSEILSALKRRGVAPPGEDDDILVVSVKKAVRRLCASDVVCARIVEQEAKRSTPIECAKLLRILTNGKVPLIRHPTNSAIYLLITHCVGGGAVILFCYLASVVAVCRGL